MPTGFRGNPAANYLQRVENALLPAREIHRQNPFANLSNRAVTPPPLPTRPNHTEPFAASTARSGGHTTGVGSSNNIVAAQARYASLSTRIAQTDERAASSFNAASAQLEQVLTTSYLMPQTAPQCRSGVGRIRSSLSRFRSLGQRKSSRARTLGQNLTNIG